MTATPDEDAVALSVVLVGDGDARSIEKTLLHLSAQTARTRMEVLVAVPSGSALTLDALPPHGFHALEIVETGAPRTTAQARATAIGVATAPVVAFVEDHSFPSPTWAERLIEAHRGPYVAVAPLIVNANPDTLTSRANFLIEYGPWCHADTPLEPHHLPGHNGSYKRETLLAYGERLAAMLEAESLIHWDRVAHGERLLLLSDVRTEHLNFSCWKASIRLRIGVGRAFAAARSHAWSPLRRAAYVLGAPAIPLVRLSRTMRALWPTPARGTVLRTAPALAGFLVLDGFGEMLGYALGIGEADLWLAGIETRRERFLRDEERALAFP